jgi:hypothetical protein
MPVLKRQLLQDRNYDKDRKVQQHVLRTRPLTGVFLQYVGPHVPDHNIGSFLQYVSIHVSDQNIGSFHQHVSTHVLDQNKGSFLQ